jgi:hypothetical protein
MSIQLHHRGRLAADAERYRPINPVYATLLRMWGPADSWDNPLVGTRFDPRLSVQRQQETVQRRRAVWDARRGRWAQWRDEHHVRDRAPRRDQPSGT